MNGILERLGLRGLGIALIVVAVLAGVFGSGFFAYLVAGAAGMAGVAFVAAPRRKR